MKLLKTLISIIAFFIILIIIMLKLGNLVVPEWNDEWLNTSTVKNFYNLDKNSLDVLAVGSSHVIKGFSSLELYKNYGISSYGIGTEQQSLYNSLAWIKESLKTQNEKVVLLEAHMFFEETPEPQNRKGFDNMKLSLNKIEAAYQDSVQRNSFENFASLIFPILRFHSRIGDLIQGKVEEVIPSPNYRGYSLSNEVCGNLEYVTLDETIKTEKPFFANYEKYLTKTINYCKSKNINIILYKGPDMDWDMERYNAVKRVADENGVPYLDFNLEKLSKEIDFNYASDCEFLNHTNIYGAQKVTNYLGKYIKENFEIEDKRGKDEFAYLDEQAKSYDYAVQNAKLVNVFDPIKYMDDLKNENFSVIYLKSNLINTNDENYNKIITGIGLDAQKLEKPNYYAIFENGKLKEEEGSDEVLAIETVVNEDKKVQLNTQSSSIYFEGIERSCFHPGLIIVVYNNKTNQVIESSYINLDNGALVMGR